MKRANKIENPLERIQELVRAEDMMNYITYYPKDQGYISLFKNWDPEDPQYEGQQRALEKRRNITMNGVKKRLEILAIENMKTGLDLGKVQLDSRNLKAPGNSVDVENGNDSEGASNCSEIDEDDDGHVGEGGESDDVSEDDEICESDLVSENDEVEVENNDDEDVDNELDDDNSTD